MMVLVSHLISGSNTWVLRIWSWCDCQSNRISASFENLNRQITRWCCVCCLLQLSYGWVSAKERTTKTWVALHSIELGSFTVVVIVLSSSELKESHWTSSSSSVGSNNEPKSCVPSPMHIFTAIGKHQTKHHQPFDWNAPFNAIPNDNNNFDESMNHWTFFLRRWMTKHKWNPVYY